MPSRRSRSQNPNLGRRSAPHSAESGPQRIPESGSTPSPSVETRATAIKDQPRAYWLASAAVSCVLLAWLFSPTILRLIKAWDTEPDYSHGFLVPPFAAIMLWLRREKLPKLSAIPGWGGLALLIASIGVRYTGERLFLAPLSGWAIVGWLAGTCWLLAGFRVFVWALPSLLFLMFMIPLPFRIEQSMSWHLQTITTKISSATLQCLGQPAIADGHTIFLGEHTLEVEQACSGLRMFMGIAAVAFAFIVLHQRPWWEKLVLAIAVAPVAMISNAFRVVATGLLLQTVSGEAAARFSHDAAGWAMIIVAAGSFGLVVAYLRYLIVPVQVDTGRHLLNRTVESI
jgi:exosortase